MTRLEVVAMCRAVHSTTREESSEAAAAALERAFAAEDASQRWESESQGLRAKLQTVEQVGPRLIFQ
jgi:hypothetical protein